MKDEYTLKDLWVDEGNVLGQSTVPTAAQILANRLGKTPSEILLNLATPGSGDSYLNYMKSMAKVDHDKERIEKVLDFLSFIEIFENSRAMSSEEIQAQGLIETWESSLKKKEITKILGVLHTDLLKGKGTTISLDEIVQRIREQKAVNNPYTKDFLKDCLDILYARGMMQRKEETYEVIGEGINWNTLGDIAKIIERSRSPFEDETENIWDTTHEWGSPNKWYTNQE